MALALAEHTHSCHEKDREMNFEVSSRPQCQCSVTPWSPAPWLHTLPPGLPSSAPRSRAPAAKPRFTDSSTDYGCAEHLTTEMTGSDNQRQR